MASELLHLSGERRGTRPVTEHEMDAINKVIDHYILHEISELRSQEQSLGAALAAAPSIQAADPFIRALGRLQARIDEFDSVLDQLDVVAVTEPAAA